MEIVKDTFGDWQVRCAPDGDECFMYQLASDERKNPVAEVSILKLPEQSEAAAGVTVVTPLGTLLTTGVILQVDSGEKRQYPFAWCSQVGCFARFGLTKPSIDVLKRGKAGEITLVSVGRPDHPVVLDLSLSGFTAAFDSLETPVLPEGAAVPNPEPAPAAQPAARAPAKPLPDLQPKR
jgi:invasion protein IalB